MDEGLWESPVCSLTEEEILLSPLHWSHFLHWGPGAQGGELTQPWSHCILSLTSSPHSTCCPHQGHGHQSREDMCLLASIGLPSSGITRLLNEQLGDQMSYWEYGACHAAGAALPGRHPLGGVKTQMLTRGVWVGLGFCSPSRLLVDADVTWSQIAWIGTPALPLPRHV